MRMNERKVQVLKFITNYSGSNGEAPTLAEIGRHFDLRSSATVFNILRALEGDGLIKRTRRVRGIEVVPPSTNSDRVNAGAPAGGRVRAHANGRGGLVGRPAPPASSSGGQP
jgi:SOS-response transcriptional repressor LexA